MKKTIPYEILYQDEAILVLNKSPGIQVLSGRSRAESLLGLLENDPRITLPEAPLPPPPAEIENQTLDLKGHKWSSHKTLTVVHRIDAETSGVVIMTKTRDATQALSAQFSDRTILKEYWALVRGTPLNESGSIDLPVGTDPKDKTRMMIRGNDSKKCRTKWVVGQRYTGVTLLKVYPVTSRRHQIRVHLKAMGYPLAVDHLYGGADLKLSEFKRHFKTAKYQEERPMMARLTLHAHSLKFIHPTTQQEMTIEAPLPKDFRGALEALEKWANRI